MRLTPFWKARTADRQRGHVEFASPVDEPQCKKLFLCQAKLLAQPREVGADRFGTEMIVSGRHRGMCGEHGICSDRFESGVKTQPLRNQCARSLEYEERRMPFVDMPRGRVDAQLGQRTHAANAQYDFLLDAGSAVAAVQAVGNVAIIRRILGQVGVKQIERYVADERLPHLDLNGSAWKLDADAHFRSIASHDGGNGKIFEVRIGVQRMLVAFGVDGLVKVALAIQQSHADEGQAHVTCRLAMIAREYAQAPGVDRQTFVETELRAKIGNEIVLAQPLRPVAAHGFLQIVVECRQHSVQVSQKNRVVGGIVQLLLVNALEKSFRVVSDLFPEMRVKPREQQARLPVPAVQEVVGKLFQSGELARKLRIDFQGVCGAAGHLRS